MKTKIEIKSVFGELLFELEKENNSIKDTLMEAIKSGANLSGASLRDANLSGASLSGANLRYANLRGANLRYASLRGASLSGASLRDASLSGANLSGASLNGASLRDANLSGASLSGASLSGASLRDADLSGASLSGADLSGASLSGANLSGAKANEGTSMFFSQCPTEGSFIAWKKAGDKIIKLEVCEDAKRSSGTSLKCRCSKAKVLEIQELTGEKSNLKSIASNYDRSFLYNVGEIVEVSGFNEDRWDECASGIHFFIDRNMAVAYLY